MQENQKSLVVVSAHAGDFVWRAGGAIALHTKTLGYRAVVVCLTCGERGESGQLYTDASVTAEKVREIRRAEAKAAAEVLGAEIHFLDGKDYNLEVTQDMRDRTVDILRDVQPNFILTHPAADPSNWDHVKAYQFALECRMEAQAHGRPGGHIIGAPQVYQFEPHQVELCNFVPDTLLNISSVWDLKWEAMQKIPGQSRMWAYYKNLAEQRGNTAGRRTKGAPITHAEAFEKVFPTTLTEL
ncbi:MULTISPECIES: PIG-L deacetylase family protein [Devosia]|uniref:PIG-L deacetylase family protein n=1 Tax=Devosia TaxID=46913 RepID=UPI000CE95EAA|nr:MULTISPECIES: PIG-L deacetylase family protein [Devosia]AVF04339.1 PIG-L domain-containing protein [Devosia sp. I507]